MLTARAKGLAERRVLYGHVFRNAMLIVIAGFPAAFIGVLFTGSLLIEVIFSLDGLGLLGFEAAINRDYPVMFGTLYFFGLIGLVMGIIGDLMYTWSIRASTSRRAADDAASTRRRLPSVPRQASAACCSLVAVRPCCSSLSLFAELLANDRPILICYDGAFYFADLPRLSRDHLRRRVPDQRRLHRPRGRRS